MMSTVILRFVCLICLWTNVVGFFFGALGGGNCCCCQPNPCCGMGFSAPLPALGSSGCGAQAAPAFGGFSSCGNSAISRPSSASSYTLPTLPTLQFPTFPAPSMPQPLPLGTNAPAYAVAPTENDSGASPSYTPISSHPPAPPPIPPSSSYADLGHVDTVAKGKIANEITGVDPPTDKIVQTSTSSPGNDFYEEKVPNIEDYGDLTSTSNRSGNDDKKNDLLTSDYSDQSFSKTKVSGVPSDLMADQDSTGDPKCSSETLKTIMQENIVSSPTISKQLIFSAGRIAFGQTIDVICSRNKKPVNVVIPLKMVWQSVMSNIALSCVVGVAVVLVVALLFLFALVLSLTFDCWWTLGRFFNIDEDTGGLLDEMDEECSSRKPWLLRLQNGKLHTVKAYASDIELI